MREFAHSIGPFKGWEESKRRSLMAACLDALNGLEIITIGSAMRVSDFRRLLVEEQGELVDPYFCCFQDVLYGIGLNAYRDFPGMKTDVVYSQQDEFGSMLEKLYLAERDFRREGALLGRLQFSDMRSSPGLQLADLVAYELRHYYHLRQSKPSVAVRYPFKRICDHQRGPNGLGMFLYIPGWKLQFQAKGCWIEAQTIIWSDWERWEGMILEMAPEPVNPRAMIPKVAKDRGENSRQLAQLRRERGRMDAALKAFRGFKPGRG